MRVAWCVTCVLFGVVASAFTTEWWQAGVLIALDAVGACLLMAAVFSNRTDTE